ncbi:MAG: xanthine dehydrogenase family protein molybdopterin-binding subunit [Sporichthyaceae bacterium]
MSLDLVPGGVGDVAMRPDALGKTVGAFPYVADLRVDGMLHAVLVRSTHPRAEVLEIDVSAAAEMPGVVAILTAADLPPDAFYGPARADRPVLAGGVVRHLGEPVLVVAAEDPVVAARAAAAVDVRYRAHLPVLDVAEAAAGKPWHPDGVVVRELTVARGAIAAPDWARPVPVPGAVHVVDGEYAIGRRAGTAAAPGVLALPGSVRPGQAPPGVDFCTVVLNSAWWHADREQIAQCLNVTPDRIRIVPAGSDGVPDGELTVAVLATMLALRTNRPVRLLDGGVRTAPGAGPAARLKYRHHVDAQGHILALQAEILLDAGAYAQHAAADLAALCASAAGPYRTPAAHVTALALRTDNPPPPPERGAAAAACVAVEAQLDRIAACLEGVDPVQVRGRNLLAADDPLPIGQVIPGGCQAGELLLTVANAPLPGRRRAGTLDRFPGSVGLSPPQGTLVRGVGHALGLTPLLPGEGQDYTATATVAYADGVATLSCAAAELGQGFLTVGMQIVREVLGAERVELTVADSDAFPAGPAWGSRLTWVAGGAVHAAATAIARKLCAEIGAERGMSTELLTARGGRIRSYDGLVDLALADVAAGRSFEQTATFSPPHTQSLDPLGSGAAFAGYGSAAHRAVVEVDVELGVVRIVELIGAFDVGRVVNLTQLLGVLEGGATSGVALALLGQFGYPTTEDLGGLSVADLLEVPQDGSWLGVKGVWDVSTGPAAAAVLAAIRNATGATVAETPVRSWHLVAT